MSDVSTTQGVLFTGLFDKVLRVEFDQARSSTDGGAILLKACDERLGLSTAMAACLVDGRQAGKINHTLTELFRQRLFGIACGYPDGNDAARLANDPVHKLMLDRDPLSGQVLASQPTLSRFENAAGPKDLLRMGDSLAKTVIERHRRRLGRQVKRITLDLDPTDDPTHGSQQLAFFNRYYDSWCYLPVAGFMRFNDEAEQYLFCCVLRPGNAPAGQGAIGILKRVFKKLRSAFPRVRLRVRLDGGFADGKLFDFLESEHVDYVVAMAKNTVLAAFAEPLMATVRARTDAATTHDYGECSYAAHIWSRARRVIIKAEVVCHPGRDPKDNARFVVTNLRHGPQRLYEEIYCARGDIENRIKELHHGLEIDRTSCTRFWANQFRVLITAAAYVLFQELRWAARRTSFARAQVNTLRERLLKMAVWVERSVRRIVFHLPTTAPDRNDWRRIARAVGAIPT
jgi:hypothetical protein